MQPVNAELVEADRTSLSVPAQAVLAIAHRVTCRVDEAALVLGVSERSMRRALDAGGDLEQLGVRVGRRQLVKVRPLFQLADYPLPDLTYAGGETA